MVVATVGFPPSRIGLLRKSSCHNGIYDPVVLKQRIRKGTAGIFGRQQILPANRLHYGQNDTGAFRVFVISDLHTDYAENMAWVRCLSTVWYRNDILIVAGDVAETYKNFVTTMSELKDKFSSVFYVPGNHDLWCRREEGNYVRFFVFLKCPKNKCHSVSLSCHCKWLPGTWAG